jgi:hypothetical protein
LKVIFKKPFRKKILEPIIGIEPMTSSLPRKCSTD